MKSLIKNPSAWLPIAFSVAVMAMWVISLSTFGAPHPLPDENAAAHLFQVWLVAEVLLVGFFATKWLPQMPKQALIVLAMQIVAVLAGCFPVYYFHL
jgi:hypothetical protein